MGDVSFGEILEAADKLTLDEQEALMGVLNRRVIEHRREELAKDIQKAKREFKEGSCKPAKPSELMKEILS